METHDAMSRASGEDYRVVVRDAIDPSQLSTTVIGRAVPALGTLTRKVLPSDEGW